MWRWLHSLPRAVRQHFHSPGASAGICVEDLHESELNKRDVKQHKAWACHRRCKHEKKEGGKGKEGQNPEFIDFWKLLHGKHSAFEAIGYSGAIALCIELTHYNTHGRFQRSENDHKNACLLKKLANSIHRLGGQSLCPVSRLQPGETAENATLDGNVLDHDPLNPDRNPDEVHVSEAGPNTVLSREPSTPESFFPETRFTFFDFPQTRFSRKTEKTKLDQHQEVGDTKKINDDPLPPDCPTTILSVEEAFAEFEDICKKYTGIGKGVLGSQAAHRGNMKSAAALWAEATSLGHSKSYYNLALCYELGNGVKQNLEEAVRLYKLAVEEGHPLAMYNLAILYMEGPDSTKKDKKRAVRLLTSAADLGLVEAQKYLGVYYSDIDTEDVEKAVHYMKMAADQQDAESQYFLGMFYEHGYGVETNTCKAAYLYNKAADSGHEDAMYSLALFHLDGIGGLPHDRHCATNLLTKSANLGNKQAQLMLEKLERFSTKDSGIGEDTYHSMSKKSSIDNEYLLKLNSSVSTPSLSDLVRGSLQQVKDKITYSPVSDAGTVSQIYIQLMVPRGMTLVPSMSQLSGVPESSVSDDDSDSDSGVVFHIGKDFQTMDDDGFVLDYDHEERDEYKSMVINHGHSASLPDIMMLTCM